jgi:hypothetical protein
MILNKQDIDYNCTNIDDNVGILKRLTTLWEWIINVELVLTKCWCEIWFFVSNNSF